MFAVDSPHAAARRLRIGLALPLLALLAGAFEVARLRLLFPWRSVGVAAFAQATFLWLALGLLVWPLAWWIARMLARRAAAGGRPRRSHGALVLACSMGMPVLAHFELDRHTRIGADMEALLGFGPWLELVLSLGIVLLLALAVERLFARASARVFVPALGLLACLVGVGLPRPTVSQAGGSASSRPNLLFLVLDTCRSDALSPGGARGPVSPVLQRMGEEAIVFEEARSASIFTLTSHLSLLTGVLPSTHGTSITSMLYDPSKAESIAELLRRAGYRTGAFVGTDVLSGRTGLTRGFDVYDDVVDPEVCETALWALVHDVQSALAAAGVRRANGRPHWFQDFQRPARDVLARAEEWIRSGGERPWFAFINLYDAHWPYLPSRESEAQLVPPHDGPLDGFLFRSDALPADYEPDAEDRAHVHGLYRAEVRDLEQVVGEFLDRLDLERANTAVLLTSDHGEAFGEAGRWMHEDVLEPQVRVPLVLRLPAPWSAGSARAGEPRKERVSGVDVAPTLLELAGLDRPPDMAGRSLLGRPVPARPILIEDHDHGDPMDTRIVLYREHWKLVRTGLGPAARHELFDLRTDPLGEHDCSTRESATLTALRTELSALRCEADARVGTGGEVPDLFGLRALGYSGN